MLIMFGGWELCLVVDVSCMGFSDVVARCFWLYFCFF